LKQCVKAPTRGDYLLDLVLTDLGQHAQTKALPKLADHSVVLATLALQTVVNPVVIRDVWLLNKAKWGKLGLDLAKVDWSSLVGTDVGQAVRRITECIYETCCANIPRKLLRRAPRSHPWLTPKCHEAVGKKCAAGGTPSYDAEAAACKQTLKDEFMMYRASVRDELLSLPRNSKRWWRLNRELLQKKAAASNVPPLKLAANSWATEPKMKADMFAKCFADKCLPLGATSATDVQEPSGEQLTLGNFLPMRRRVAKRILEQLDIKVATGSDKLPAIIWKRCAKVLSLAIVLVARLCMLTGKWPEDCRFH
jgi:hypothetical protein